MADVYGSIGGQDVELNNAATEATLKQLVQAITIMSAKMGGAKSPKQIAEEMAKFQKAMEKANKTQEKTNKLAEEKQKLEEEEIKRKKKQAAADELAAKQLSFAGDAAQSLANNINKVGGAFIGLANDLANMGNDINAVAGIFSKIPVVGGLVGSTFGAVAGAATKTYKAFNTAASVGANFNGSIGEMQKAVAGTGLTLDQYTNLIKNNGQELATFGGSVGEGAKRFTQMSKQIRGSQLGDELSRLGYTTEDINAGLAKYSSMVTKSAGGRALSDQELIKHTGDYLTNLDAVAKLTGKNKEALQKEQEARQADAQFRVLSAKLGVEGTKNLNMMMDSMSESEKEAAKQILATGTLSGEAAQQLMITNPQAAKALLQASADARKAGTFTREAAFQIDDAFNEGAKAAKNNAAAQVLGTHEAEKWGKGIVDLYDRQARVAEKDASLRKTFADQEADRQNKLNQGVQGLDPAQVKSNMEALANMSNKLMEALANSPLLGDMLKAFESAMTTAIPAIVEGLTFIGKHSTAIGWGLGLVAASVITLNTIIKLAQAAEAMRSLGLLKGAGMIKTVFSLLGGGIRGLLGPIGLLLTAAYLLYENFDDVKDAVGGLIDWIQSKLPSWAGGISQEEYKRRVEEREAGKKLREAKAGETKATQENTAEVQKSTAAAQDAASASKSGASVNWADPASVYKYAKGGGGATGGGATPATASPGTPIGGDMSGYLKTVAMLESGGNANAKAGTSSASGMFQFTKGTWQQMTKEMGKNYSDDDRFDPQKSAEVMAYFTQKQKAQMEKGLGRGVSSTDMYMGHFLGAGGATKFLKAKDQNAGQSAAALDPAAAAANKSIYYDKTGRERSVQEVYDLMNKKVQGAETRVASGNIPQAVASLGGGLPAAPTGAAVVAATSNPPAHAATADASGNKTSSGSGQVQPVRTQESAESLLASLNMKMDQLIKVSKDTHGTNEKQLRAQQSSGNADIFASVPI